MNRLKSSESIILAGMLAFLLLLYLLAPLPKPNDWAIFREASWRAFHRESLYSPSIAYFNPPWLALFMLPFSLLPYHLGQALLATCSTVLVVLILMRWEARPDPLKVVAVLTSPAMFYIIYQGQVDVLVLGGLLLPPSWWLVVALAKPQVSLPLFLHIPRPHWQKALLITLAVVALTFLWWGNWIQDFLAQPNQVADTGRNFWANLFPFQVPLGIALASLGFSRQEERLLVMSAPFLLPYAAMSSFIGLWMAGVTYLQRWQVALVWLSWWGALFYRFMT